MQFRQTTVLGLFDSSQRHFTIPVYQRAYSWEAEQLDVFLSDLKEQISGENSYFLGNILLETLKKDISYEVIDGQQRLTTVIILIRAIIDVLEKRSAHRSIDIDIPSKISIYLKNGGNSKLRPVEYDRACFEVLIIDGHKKFEVATPSQTRYVKAKSHFLKELEQMRSETILAILQKLEDTEITCIELQDKKDAALMFELQNNRGKDLTNMEKLKSFFMYQMYVYSPEEESNSNIEHVSNIFKMIYQLINDLKTITEDNVLNYHCQTYINGYNYRKIDEIKARFLDSSDRINWIKDFINQLHTTFSNIKKMENSKLPYLEDLRKLVIPAFIYPFVIKGYKYFEDGSEELDSLYHILEIVVFRYRLVNSRADLVSRLNDILTNFSGDLTRLRDSIKQRFHDTWYWSDQHVGEYLNGYMYRNPALTYLLWKYEDSLQNKGYRVGSCQIENQQIEHISPQTENDGDPVASGYQVDENSLYSTEFVEEYLNCLGNLMLISGSHNASIGNKPFSDKLDSYKSNPLLKQQAQIKYFLDVQEPAKWDTAAIDRRHESIVDLFAVDKWSLETVDIPAIIQDQSSEVAI